MTALDLHHRKARLKFPGNSFGFTLLEVMVALAVMAIVLVSVYRMHSQSLTMNTAARFYTLAPMLAQGKMAEQEVLSSGAFTGDSGVARRAPWPREVQPKKLSAKAISPRFAGHRN